MVSRKRTQTSTPATESKEDAVTNDTPAIVPNPKDVRIVVPEGAERIVESADAITPVKAADLTWGAPKRGSQWAAVKVDGERVKVNVAVTDRSLDDLETVVVNGLLGFIEAGRALLEIRVRKLWEETGATSFGAYAMARFALSRARLYQLIDIAQVSAILVDAGLEPPRLANRMSDLAVLKNDPEKLVAVVEEQAATTESGDVSDVDRNALRDAAAKAANETGKNLKDDRSETLPEADADDDDDDLDVDADDEEEDEEEDEDEETDDEEEESDEEEDEETEAAPAPRTRTSGEPRRANVAPSTGPTSEQEVLSHLTAVVNAFAAGKINPLMPNQKAAVQDLLGYTLGFMAGQTVKSGNGVYIPTKLVISQATAKRIFRLVTDDQKKAGEERRAKEQADAKAALTPAQRKQAEKNEATVRLAKEAEASKAAEVVEVPDTTPEPVIPAADTLSKNPKTAEECYAIIDAQRAWESAGRPGQSPVSGQQVRRANARLDTLTEQDNAKQAVAASAAPVAQVEEVTEGDEADDEAEALLAEFGDGDDEEETDEEEEDEEEFDVAV